MRRQGKHAGFLQTVEPVPWIIDNFARKYKSNATGDPHFNLTQ